MLQDWVESGTAKRVDAYNRHLLFFKSPQFRIPAMTVGSIAMGVALYRKPWLAVASMVVTTGAYISAPRIDGATIHGRPRYAAFMDALEDKEPLVYLSHLSTRNFRTWRRLAYTYTETYSEDENPQVKCTLEYEALQLCVNQREETRQRIMALGNIA